MSLIDRAFIRAYEIDEPAAPVHATAGPAAPASVISRLAAHVRDHPQGKHGAHAYDLETYGLTPARVQQRLAAYISRFGLPAE